MSKVNFNLTDCDFCWDEKCSGRIEIPVVENCSCHISAPCYECENSEFICNTCKRTAHEVEIDLTKEEPI